MVAVGMVGRDELDLRSVNSAVMRFMEVEFRGWFGGRLYSRVKGRSLVGIDRSGSR